MQESASAGEKTRDQLREKARIRRGGGSIHRGKPKHRHRRGSRKDPADWWVRF